MEDRYELAHTLERELLSSAKYPFSELKPTQLPVNPSVYAVFDMRTEKALYVGRQRTLA